MLGDGPHVQRMLACGAAGYLLKNTGRAELLSALRQVAAGIPFLGSEMAVRLLNSSAGPGTAEEAKVLSKRELEVLRLVAEGYTNAQIADRLFLSKRTIETHRQHMLEKTGARNTANLVKYALRHGYLSPGA